MNVNKITVIIRREQGKLVHSQCRNLAAYDVFKACFLVDASGKIVATTDDLRGEKLLDVLRKYFKAE